MEALERRVLMSAAHSAAAADSVKLQRVDGSNLPLAGNRDAWIVIHGLGGSADSVSELATAVDATSSTDQVFVVDWSTLAATTDAQTAADNTQIVADALAQKIKQAGLPASRINLMGFSIGCLIEARLAADLHTSGGVNRIVALDPVAPAYGSNAKGHSIRPDLNLAADSQYSIAFHAGTTYQLADTTADDTVLLTNVGSTPASRHDGVYYFFRDMTEINNTNNPDAVSQLFSMQRIETGQLPAWKKNAYSAVYEAQLSVKAVGSKFAPDLLQYKVGRTGHTVTVSAG